MDRYHPLLGDRSLSPLSVPSRRRSPSLRLGCRKGADCAHGSPTLRLWPGPSLCLSSLSAPLAPSGTPRWRHSGTAEQRNSEAAGLRNSETAGRRDGGTTEGPAEGHTQDRGIGEWISVWSGQRSYRSRGADWQERIQMTRTGERISVRLTGELPRGVGYRGQHAIGSVSWV